MMSGVLQQEHATSLWMTWSLSQKKLGEAKYNELTQSG
jgi:hypothetical protein